MEKIFLRGGFVVFALFFGASLIQAIRGGDWLSCIFWLVMGALFIYLDNTPAKKSQADQH